MEKKLLEESQLVVTSTEIIRILPHKYPFLMIDKVYISEVGIRGCGKKNVTMNEHYFMGHFPDNPIVPGVLIIESIAQTIAIVYSSSMVSAHNDEDLKRQVGYLGAVEIKFLRAVRPGDTMLISVELIKRVRNISNYGAIVYVDGKEMVKGNVTVTQNG